MDQSKWIQVFFLSILFTGAESQDSFRSFVVRAGDDVTLSCENVPKGHRPCNSTTWLYSNSGQSPAVALFEYERIINSRSNRLSVTSNSSLVLKDVSAEDAGRYTCREFVSKPPSDTVVQLSVVTLTEQQHQDTVTLSCSVSPSEQCSHKVKWLFKGNNGETDHPDIKKSPPSPCSAAVTFPTSHFVFTPNFDFFKCEVEENKKVTVFTFSSDESTTGSGGNAEKTIPVWLYISVAVVVVIIIISVTLILLRRTKGEKRQKPSNEGESSDPALNPAASERKQEPVEPEEGVSYASINYTKKPCSSSRAKNCEEGVSVTYSTVKTPSTDPNNLYASVIHC